MKRRLTFMVIPHTGSRPVKITLSLSFFLFAALFWTALTLWAGFLASRHIDYVTTKTDNRLMKIKVDYFAGELQKSREMLEQVKENDEMVRSLLEMKSRKAIIEDDGRGGPTPAEKRDLERVLSDRVHEMSYADIHRQTAALRDETRRQLESYREIFRHLNEERMRYRATPGITPCAGYITSRFGMRRHPVHRTYEYHSGLDIANDRNTPIYATADGTAILCDWQSGYGRLIVIDHGHGYRTYYGHLARILIRKDEPVRRGQLIGLMGSTGTSTGNHLHYEVRRNGRATNPTRYMRQMPVQLVRTGDIE